MFVGNSSKSGASKRAETGPDARFCMIRGMESELSKRVDDVIREELLSLGWEYSEVVKSVSGADDRCIVELKEGKDQFEIAAPEPDLADDIFRARVRRRLRVALEGPDPFAEPIPDADV